MELTGGCHCGAVRYVASGEPHHHAICHCSDCRRASGGMMTGWALYDDANLVISGEPTLYHSSEHGERLFCGQCGTSLFYRNQTIFPSQTDIISGTLDDPAQLPPGAQIQLAERVEWVAHLDALPGFERFPG
jgi:hypothetical protein